jgi:hypothetical protein
MRSAGGLESKLLDTRLASLVCSIIAHHFGEKSTQSAALEIPVEPDIEAARIVRVMPNDGRRHIAARFGLTEAVFDRVGLEADNIILCIRG